MKTPKYFSITFLFITFSFSVGIFINNINALLANYLIGKEFKDNSIKSKKCSNYVDWKKEYPVDDEKKANKVKFRQEAEKVNINKFHFLYDKIKTIISKFEHITKRELPYKMNFIEFGHFIDKLIGGNMFLNLDGLIRFDNGYFGFLVQDKDSFEEDGKKTVEFAKYLESQSIKFAYILCPSKFSKFKKELPQGMVDYSNENADSFLKVLYDNNIKVLDLRVDLNKEFPNHFEAFFKTDHHWKPETGFWATKKSNYIFKSKTRTKLRREYYQERKL